MKTLMLNLAVLLLLGACTSPQTAQLESGAVLDAMTSKWAKAFNSNDGEALGALYAEDAIMMPPKAISEAAMSAAGIPGSAGAPS